MEEASNKVEPCCSGNAQLVVAPALLESLPVLDYLYDLLVLSA